MGSSASDVSIAEQHVKRAESRVATAKTNREYAKRSGNYRTATKNCRMADGRLGNVYDYNVWAAQNELKEAKAQLARAKKKK
mgnify:FL=1